MGTPSEGVHSISRRTGRLDMVGTVMGICQKCFIDTNKILDTARYMLGDEHEYKDALTEYNIRSAARSIVNAIADPLADIPKGTVEFTISRKAIQMMDIDVLGEQSVILMYTGGYDDHTWYRLDMPRGFALKCLAELEDTWLHGPDANIRTLFRRSYKTLQKALGV